MYLIWGKVRTQPKTVFFFLFIHFIAFVRITIKKLFELRNSQSVRLLVSLLGSYQTFPLRKSGSSRCRGTQVIRETNLRVTSVNLKNDMSLGVLLQELNGEEGAEKGPVQQGDKWARDYDLLTFVMSSVEGSSPLRMSASTSHLCKLPFFMYCVDLLFSLFSEWCAWACVWFHSNHMRWCLWLIWYALP